MEEYNISLCSIRTSNSPNEDGLWSCGYHQMGDKDEQRGECYGKRSNLQRRLWWGGLGLECWQPITFSSQDGSLQEHQLYKHHTRSITFQYHCSIYSNLLLLLLLRSRTRTPLVAYNIPTINQTHAYKVDEDASLYDRAMNMRKYKWGSWQSFSMCKWKDWKWFDFF